jgi:nuclease S1
MRRRPIAGRSRIISTLSGSLRTLLIVAAALSATPVAIAWGCQGHQIIAFIAENHLNHRARAAALKILAASPIDSSLPRYCQPRSADPLADASTWADDIRSVRPETAPWHFVDIPRGARKGSLAPYCPPATGCVVSALDAQLRVLKDPHFSAAARADALRFVIHLVGDIHQPLHDVTNNDLGGNCVPVEFFGELPRETNAARESFSPELHWVWDVGIIDRFAHGESSPEIALDLDRKFSSQISVWDSQPADFAAWAWEAHALADSVAYGRLPHAIPVEAPMHVSSCADGNHVALRLLAYHEDLGPAYQAAAAPVVQRQLAKAGARLAALLNSLWH